MRVLPGVFVLCIHLQAPGQSPAPRPLHPGQQISLSGTLEMKPQGRLQFVVVRTAEPTVPMIEGEDRKLHSGQATREVGLSGYNRYDLLFQHRGQAVTVSGTVMTDSASPYYFHSTSLKAGSIRLANGTDLLGQPRTRPRLAADVGQYTATVLLPADLTAPWQYSARGEPDPERQFLSCSSNGGGDVVNCFCGEGFRAIAADSRRAGRPGEARLFSDSGTAQFGVGDEARAVELHVTCSR